ncbi:MAG: hypothetical protein HY290_03300 [Planctomycetia bacterium]|nr:hypothetical protein [Planctomycetia bacterium]
MRRNRIFIAIAIVALGALLAGCGVEFKAGPGGSITVGGANSKSAEEERTLTEPHVTGSGLDVQTDLGSVEVTADKAINEVQVVATVKAFAETEDEAREHLKEIKVKLERRDDKVLKITCEYPPSKPGVRGSCSFKVRVPEAQGAKIRSGNGSITLKSLAGVADVKTDIGAVTISDQDGKVIAHSGNGAIRLTKSAGDAELKTDIGSVTGHEITGKVTARSGNGAIDIAAAGGDVEASTDIGSVTVKNAPAVTARSGNGAMTVVQAKGKVQARTAIGQVKLEQVSGPVEAESGNGAVIYAPASDSAVAFHLKTDIGAVTVHLPASAAGSIEATTDVGAVTVNGSRKARSVTGERSLKKIVLSDKGPSSTIHTGNGSVTITLD